MAGTIQFNEFLENPDIKQLLSELQHSTDLENDVKLPYVMRKKILMSPGVWNGYFYSAGTIRTAFENSDWEAKEVRSLFNDHEDLRSREWIGEVKNIRMDDDDVVGDLYIVDKATAIKLAYGAKMGISPKVTGREESGEMLHFVFDNMSVVINPAVKTAYINNAQKTEEEIMAAVTAFEKKRKELGMTSEQFYAIPRKPPSESKLPIFDVAHVRNAMARFNQVKGVSETEKAKAKSKIIAAANKFGINVDKFKEVNTMADKKEVNETSETKEVTKENFGITKKVGQKDTPIQKASSKPVVPQTMAQNELIKFNAFAEKYIGRDSTATMADVSAAYDKHVKSETIEMSDVMEVLNTLRKEVSELKGIKNQEEGSESAPEVTAEEKPAEEEPVKEPETEGEEKPAEEVTEGKDTVENKDAQIKQLSMKVEKMQAKINEPDKATMKTVENSEMKGDIDLQIMQHLKSIGPEV